MGAWELYFATLVGMSLHPGYNRQDTHKPTLEEMATLADTMVKITEARKCQ